MLRPSLSSLPRWCPVTSTPHLLLGVDTGGTYTDAVLLNAVDHSIVASAKALTTREDLSVGIGEAVARVTSRRDPTTVALVSVSTTLATNAVVEGHGSPVLVILIGFDEAMVARSGIAPGFSDATIVSIAGGHDHYGLERAALDSDRIAAALAEHGEHVGAVAVASSFAVRNPAHERRARSLIETATDLPVTISSELSESLDAPRRALTTVLNARLLSRISELLAAVRTALLAAGISAPILVAKGDGSLAAADSVARRPIETVLSGPAASMVGAGVLSGLDDFVLADMGGTTTDVGIVTDGRPRWAADGAMVGGWRTMVHAIDVHTIGLGGDSAVWTDRDRVTVGPQRLIPLALLGERFPSLIAAMVADLVEPPARDLACRFVLRHENGRNRAGLSVTERRILERVGTVPVAVHRVAPGAVEGRALSALAARGVVQVGGFTPSDAAHVLEEQRNWNRQAALAGADLLASYTGLSAEVFCRRVWSETVGRSATAILELGLGGEVRSTVDDRIIRAATDGSNLLGGVAVSMRPTVPIVAVGGPANVYYPEVAKRLGAELAIPEQYAVANAVGAASGFLVADATAEVFADGPGMFRIVSMGHTSVVTTASVALSRATELAIDRAKASLGDRANGLNIGPPTIEVDVVRHDRPEATGDDGLYSARCTATVRARPLGVGPIEAGRE